MPRVLGVDDFALRRGQVYATILIDAETGQRVEVLPSRKADVLETWLLSHLGVQVVCRDGSGAYGEAVRRALPGAVQAGDRWHLWHSLGEAVLKEVAAHSACRAAAGPPLNEGWQARTTAERWRQVHDLTGRGTGLLECSRRLGLSLNTVKRYARAAEPERMIRAPRYRATLVDPYREHLRARRAEDPAVPVHQLLAGDPRAGLPRQHEPALPLHHPGPRRSRPAAPISPARHPDAAHQARRRQQQPAGAARQANRRLPGDDQPRRPGPRLRRPAPPRTRQPGQAQRMGPRGPGSRPAGRVRLSPAAWTWTPKPSSLPSRCPFTTTGPRA